MPRSHVTDLSRLQRDASANYLLLQRLWRNPESGTRLIGLRQQGHDLGYLRLRRLERSHWTEHLELQYFAQTEHPWLKPTHLQIRIYHDVKLAEVVSYQQHQPREGRYAYPNPAMFQPDEKVQVNALLLEWLKFTLQLGYTPQTEILPDE